MELSIILGIIAVIIIITLLLMLMNNKQKLLSTSQSQQQILQEKERQLQRSEEQLQRLQQEHFSLNGNYNSSLTRNEELEKNLLTQKQEVEKLQEKFKETFENLANQILEAKSEKFTKQNQSNLEILLKPLGEQIKAFEKQVAETYNNEAKDRYHLAKEIQRLSELNQTLSEEANNLTKALKADTKKQGNWGEVILERILEMSGLQKGIHYIMQDAVRDQEGQLRKPDVTILLPEEKQIIVDAKVSLTAYSRYCDSTEIEEQKQHLKQHLSSVKSHIDLLSNKNYHELYKNSPEFILLFVPLEPAFGLALTQDNDLYEYAFKKRIILVSISTLLATLRIIDSLWRLDKQNRNASDIFLKGAALYDKLVGFVEDMQRLGSKINDAQNAYGDAMNKLQTGRGNLLRKAEQMRQLGLSPNKSLPEELLKEQLPLEEDEED